MEQKITKEPVCPGKRLQDILTNTHNFKQFRTENCMYVDKTRFAYELLKNKMTQCFLSRPRRFGKSLFLNMLKEMFSGNKELFKGLYIYDRYDFTPYPVIHLSFTMLEYAINVSEVEALHIALTKYLSGIAEDNELNSLDGPYLGTLIKKISNKYQSPVVLLIDDYDKPLLPYINAPETRKKVLKVLKNMYSPLKDLTDKVKFLFITGVSKFSQVSIFSDLNNLDDLTLNENYATIAGFTQEELEYNYKEYIHLLADRYNKTTDAILKQIKSWYDGYSWDGKTYVYAPFSISNLFKQRAFKNYWFGSATPSFLIDVIDELKKGTLTLNNFESYHMFDSDMEKYDINNIKLMPFLFQTGYLSIYDIDLDMLKVRIPNMEVRTSFYKHLFEQLSNKNSEQLDILKKSIYQCHINDMMKSIKSIMATIPYQILDKKERTYHSHFHTILKTINEKTQSEISTNLGRIDTVMETSDTIYIFEFKMKSALEGIRQIKQKRYAEAYLNQNKKLVFIGVKFSKTQRNIADYKYEIISQNDVIEIKKHSETNFTEKIIVLYSQHDESFKDKLIMHLQPIKKFGIVCFDDVTFDEIQLSQAISNAKNIILLLSPQFLASDLFQSEAIETLSEVFIQKDIKLFPIITNPCAYKAVPWLKSIATNPEPLAALSELKQDELLADIIVENARQL
jgi:hypothetical protein